jgi:hypothetical protein
VIPKLENKEHLPTSSHTSRLHGAQDRPQMIRLENPLENPEENPLENPEKIRLENTEKIWLFLLVDLSKIELFLCIHMRFFILNLAGYIQI